MRKNTPNTPRHDNPTSRPRILAHKMDSQLHAIYNTFVVDVYEGQVRLWRDVVDVVVSRVVDVD
jgi:hypothetical protein